MRAAGNLMMSCLAAIATEGPSDGQLLEMMDVAVEAQEAMEKGPVLHYPGASDEGAQASPAGNELLLYCPLRVDNVSALDVGGVNGVSDRFISFL